MYISPYRPSLDEIMFTGNLAVYETTLSSPHGLILYRRSHLKRSLCVDSINTSTDIMWWNKGKWNICTASSLNMSIRARDTGNPADDEKCSERKELIEWRECIWAPLTPWYISGKGVLWLWRVLIVFRAASTAPGKTFHRQSGLVDTGFLHDHSASTRAGVWFITRDPGH